MWFLSPSGWPTHAAAGSLFATRLTANGWKMIDDSQVQPAIDAYNAQQPLPPAAIDYLTEQEAAGRIAGTGPLGEAARSAYVTKEENRRHYVKATNAPSTPFDIGAAFTTVPLPAISYDTSRGFDTATALYTVPLSGYYDVNATLRVADGAAAGVDIGFGVDTANRDSSTFVWTATKDALRNTLTYARNEYFTAGDQVRLFAYVDAGGVLQRFIAASLSLSLIGQG